MPPGRPVLLLLSLTALLGAAVPERGELELADGSRIETWTLRTAALEAGFAPALGGKLLSLRAPGGPDLLSRSERPYRPRSPGAAYGQTEFDGMDECFPALATGPYPVAPWTGVPIDDHGELCQQAWRRLEHAEGLLLVAAGRRFPYRFERLARLEDETLVLDYRVENLGADPLWCSYVNHPLFAAASGCGLELDPDVPVRLLLSRAGELGEPGPVGRWGDWRRPDGRAFHASQFASGSGEYYKYVVGPLREGRAVVRHHSGQRIELRWDSARLPYLAVWVAQGAVGGLHHLGAEIAMSRHEDLAAAYAAGEAQAIAPHASLAWQTRMRLLPPDGLPASGTEAMLAGSQQETP